MRLPGLFFALMFSALMIQACESRTEHPVSLADAHALRADGDIFAMIASDSNGATMKLWLSSSTSSRLGICLVAAGERCDARHATYRQATEVFQKQGRKILGLSENITASTQGTYVVVDDSGAVAASFRLSDANQGNAGGDGVAGGLALIDKATLQSELTHITKDEYKGRLSATPENDQIADWIIDHLRRLNIPPAGEDYRQRFRLGVGPTGSSQTANIVAKLEGTDPTLKNEYVVIGAHMDHAGTLGRGYTCSQGSGSGDQICNGADDNGSGTIAVLNVAKALVSARSSLKRSVLIMWFSGEEEGLLGSKHYVANPIVPLDRTVYMINMDMVGNMRTFSNTLAALGGGTSRNGKQILEDIGKRYPSIKLSISAQAGGGSDHVPFMAKGIPGVFFHTGVSNNPHYHKTSDHVDKIDFDGMTIAAKIAFETAYRISTSDQSASYTGHSREPLVSEEEMAETCHHLIKNPFLQEVVDGLDFTNGNSGLN